MADRDEDEVEEEEVVRKGDDAKAHKELNKLGGGDEQVREVDTAKAEGALSQLASQEQAEKEARLARERELAKVKIDRADVDLIISEMEVDEARAERVLREHNGEAIAALRFLVQEDTRIVRN